MMLLKGIMGEVVFRYRVLLVSMMFLSLGAAPATQPNPVSPEQLRTWFVQLADPDPELREQARIALMGIERRQLPALQDIVEQGRPLRPSQVVVLQDIVTHVYLAGEPYEVIVGGGGFLGLRWDPTDEQTWHDPPGLLISVRIPGFTAYRFLRQGDVIVGIDEFPNQQLTTHVHLSSMLALVPPGTVLNFRVLRNGQMLRIPIPLGIRPDTRNNNIGPFENFESARQQKADEYWAKSFAPLLADHGMSSAQQ